MFTGIIDHTGRIADIVERDHGRQMIIETQFIDILQGESIAIDGICLTATKSCTHALHCDLSDETLRLTRARRYCVGDRVNVERALALGERMGGHTVTGHVDGLATIASSEPVGDCCRLILSGLTQKQMALVWSKGSIAVDGISLTINTLTECGVELMIIPQTIELTTLSARSVGESVHIEFDPMAKIIQHQLSQRFDAKEVSHVN